MRLAASKRTGDLADAFSILTDVRMRWHWIDTFRLCACTMCWAFQSLSLRQTQFRLISNENINSSFYLSQCAAFDIFGPNKASCAAFVFEMHWCVCVLVCFFLDHVVFFGAKQSNALGLHVLSNVISMVNVSPFRRCTSAFPFILFVYRTLFFTTLSYCVVRLALCSQSFVRNAKEIQKLLIELFVIWMEATKRIDKHAACFVEIFWHRNWLGFELYELSMKNGLIC